MSLGRILGALSRRGVAPLRALRAALAPGVADFPFKGYEANAVHTPHVDSLSDAELQELNRLLPWMCFTADRHGRRFGRPADIGKRDTPQPVPDYRTPLLEREFGLADKHVLEFGCFEGVHTVGLAMRARQVTAVDARIANVVKTMVRTGFFGLPVTVFKCDLENAADCGRLPQADVVHHVGVLYHLRDPVGHLLALGRLARVGVMLDTHIARPAEATLSYAAAGRTVAYKHWREGGHADPFSGMYDHAKWLTLDTLRALLAAAGFERVRVAEERAERNGPRVLLFAQRSPAPAA